jgi:hypothetical protein
MNPSDIEQRLGAVAVVVEGLAAEVAVLNAYVAALPPSDVDFNEIRTRAERLVPQGFGRPKHRSPQTAFTTWWRTFVDQSRHVGPNKWGHRKERLRF